MKVLNGLKLTFVMVLLATQSACGGDAANKAVTAPSRVISIDTAAVPAAYSAALPDSVAGLKSWVRGERLSPPFSHVVDHLLSGDAQWLARLETASRAIPPADRDAWGRVWQAAFQFETATPAFCAPTRRIMAAPPSATRVAIAVPFARTCALPEDRALILRADTPSQAVLAYFDPWLDSEDASLPEFDDRLVQVAREIILAPPAATRSPKVAHVDSRGGTTFEMDPFRPAEDARSTAFTLAGQKGNQGVDALLKIHAEIKDRKVADQVALAFRDSGNERGRALAMSACQRLPKDTMCQPRQTFEATPAEEPPAVAQDIIKQRIAQLRELGFSKVAQLDVKELDDDDATSILLIAGYGLGFDVETGMYPNQHDSLMRELAALVEPALRDAVFEEHAPPIDDESSPYELIAYSAGKRFRTPAANLGDWYDVGAVLDLLNALLAQRNADARFMILGTQDQSAIVLVAPVAALARAVEAGVIEPGDPSQAETIGKGFEDRVFERLRKEEGS